jgi:hypothetical protein
MTSKVGSTLRVKAYRGCGIRAFSYEAGSGTWIPEACFWLYTAEGWRRLWIQSFERFFAPQEMSFPSQKEADDFAFRLARVLIDKTLPDLEEPISSSNFSLRTYLAKISRTDRRPFSIARIIREFRKRA